MEALKDTVNMATLRELWFIPLIWAVLYQAAVIIPRLYFSPISNFPGPKLAAATGWYEMFWDLWDASFPDRVEDMHEKYGTQYIPLV